MCFHRCHSNKNDLLYSRAITWHLRWPSVFSVDTLTSWNNKLTIVFLQLAQLWADQPIDQLKNWLLTLSYVSNKSQKKPFSPGVSKSEYKERILTTNIFILKCSSTLTSIDLYKIVFALVNMNIWFLCQKSRDEKYSEKRWITYVFVKRSKDLQKGHLLREWHNQQK